MQGRPALHQIARCNSELPSPQLSDGKMSRPKQVNHGGARPLRQAGDIPRPGAHVLTNRKGNSRCVQTDNERGERNWCKAPNTDTWEWLTEMN